MYLGNDLLEAVPILREDLRNPGYLGKFKRYLKKKYEETINQKYFSIAGVQAFYAIEHHDQYAQDDKKQQADIKCLPGYRIRFIDSFMQSIPPCFG